MRFIKPALTICGMIIAGGIAIVATLSKLIHHDESSKGGTDQIGEKQEDVSSDDVQDNTSDNGS